MIRSPLSMFMGSSMMMGSYIDINCSLIISKNNIKQILHLDDTKYPLYDKLGKLADDIDKEINRLENKRNNIRSKSAIHK